MTVYGFTGRAATAARHLYDSTSLASSPWIEIRGTGTDAGLGVRVQVTVTDRAPLSPGEAVLVDVLASMTSEHNGFGIPDLWQLDDHTAWTAWWAIGLFRGLTAEVAMVRDLIGGAV